jgi:hypothetical protein
MYAFKVMVTTLLLILIGALTYVGIRGNGSGRNIALAIILIEMLSVVAIWG